MKKVLVMYYDVESGVYYTREDFEAKFASMSSEEKTARFYPCVKTEA